MSKRTTNKIQQKNNMSRPIYKHYPESKQAILFIHGMMEGPKQFRHLAQMAYNTGYSIKIILLPGHGVQGSTFAKTSYKQWVMYVSEQIKQMKKQYEEILIVGHSMGAILALCEMTADDHQIVGSVLIDTPIKVHLWPRVIEGAIKIGAHTVKPWERYTRAEYHAISVYQMKGLDYIRGIVRYYELLVLIHYARKQIHKIQKPILLIFAKKDEFVSLKSRRFFKKVPSVVEEVILEDSGHFCYDHMDLIRVEEAFKIFIKMLKHPQ